MTNPLWSDERIVVCADINSMGCHATSKDATELRITNALKEMRDEYEAELTKLKRATDYANDCVDELAHKNNVLIAENERLATRSDVVSERTT